MAVTVEEYLSALLAQIGPLAVERVPVADALGRGLAEDLVAGLPVPPFDTSAMDGFAVRAADAVAGARLPVTGDVPAGPGEPVPVPPGAAVRIMTGAPLPPGADCVVPVEDTDQPAGPTAVPDTVLIVVAPRVGAHIRRRGEDVPAGALVLPAGTRLTPAALASAISVGHGELPVRRRPRVAVVSTGSELVAPGEVPGPGQIPDSNATLVAALVRAAGHEVVAVHRVPDDVAALADTLAQAAAASDLIISTGGVSAGAFDVVKETTVGAGFTYTKVAMQPGKPQGHGFVEWSGGRTPMLALPGNPVSVFVSFHLFARPVLDALAGIAGPGRGLLGRGLLGARAGTGWSSPRGRRQYIPVRLQPPGGLDDPLPVAVPTHPLGSGSHLVASLHRANAIAVVGEDEVSVAAGALVPVMIVEAT